MADRARISLLTRWRLACGWLAYLACRAMPANWGPDCTVAQVHKQGEQAVRRKLEEVQGLRIIGTPVLKLITHSEEA